MEQEIQPLDGEGATDKYAALGAEIAFVLASARDAAAAMREQAKVEADAVVAQAYDQVEGVKAEAEGEASKLVLNARTEASRILLDARQKVLAIVESAQARVAEAERAAEEANRRRNEILQAESDLETGVAQMIAALQVQIDVVRSRRDAQVDQEAEAPLGSADLEEFFVSSAGALFDAERAAPRGTAGTPDQPAPTTDN